MCTVSFIPVNGNFFITSNRDEKNSREKAFPPRLYHHNNTALVYPRDACAGGTWIALKENGDAAVLLNGAFIPYIAEPAYRKSRGVLLLDILSATYPAQIFSQTELSGIAPFTLILFEKKCLYECRWDGTERYCRQLSRTRPHIWSSVTLYDGPVIKKREEWFRKFLDRIPSPTRQDIFNFHRFSGDGDQRNSLVMERERIYSTVSITSLLINNDRGVMQYHDQGNNCSAEIRIELPEVKAVL